MKQENYVDFYVVCNTSIGALGDNLEGIERARTYLIEAVIWEGKKP